MAKQDVLDAINATIVPNGTKAINADSLRNLLTMMVENAGEGGSGDGALRVIVPDTMALGQMIAEAGELSPSSWVAMRPELESALGGVDLSEYDAVVNASFAHNANVAQQIIEKGKAGQGVSVVLDQMPYSSALISLMVQAQPDMEALIEEASMGGVQPAGLLLQYVNATPEGEVTTGGDMFYCVLVPIGNISIDGMNETYPSNMLIYLNLDGSLSFMEIESETESGS